MISFVVHSIRLEGFRSFREAQTFVVDRPPGLYFISGQNFVDPIGSNGSGKSTIWDALIWCLFGKTLLGVKGGNNKTWDSKSCRVEICLAKDSIEYTIIRTHNPNSLTIIKDAVETTVTQADLDAFLNLDWEQFIFALIVGQFNALFLDKQPTEKLNLFSVVMGLDFWEDCSKESSTRLKALEERRQSLDVEEGAICAKVEALNAEKGRLRAESATFESSRATEITELDRQARDFLVGIQQTEINLRLNKAKRGTKTEALNAAQFDQERIQSNIDNIQPQIDELDKAIVYDESTIQSLTDQFSKWRLLKSSDCPYCEQPIDDKVIQSHKHMYMHDIMQRQKYLKKNQATLATLQEQLKINQDLQQEAKTKQKEIQKELDSVEIDHAVMTTNLTDLTKELRRTREKIEKTREGANPYSKLIQDCEANLAKQMATLQDAENRQIALAKDIEAAEFWTRGFKQLRMWIIADNLAALEVESNTALSKLGLVNWKLRFQMERETAKGGVNRGFHVLVQSKGMKEETYVPWEVWSGGEKQRLRLSGVCGWASLIQNWKGLSFNFSVWDEPSSYLSEEGIEDLIQFLSEEAVTTGKAIYMIDQRHLESPYFTGAIKVEKHEKGSRILESTSQ